jgi:Zn-finger nucleic acid-binding protein
VATVNGNRLWYCQNCRGILLEMSLFSETISFERRIRKDPPTTSQPIDVQKELQRQLVCPQCANPMSVHPYAGPGNIVIDNCPICRLNWLDYKELQRIITSPERVSTDLSWLPLWQGSLDDSDFD